MLEKVDLTRCLSKEEYRQRWPALRTHLYDLQNACWEAGIPSAVVFEGWDAAGKGTTINKLTQRLDPRGFKLYPIQAPRTHELHMPWLWRFWLKTPARGEMAIFDRSWYGRVLVERVEKLTPRKEWEQAYQDIVDFERTLTASGVVLVKFFLHIRKKEQKKRFRKLEKDPLLAWKVQKEDWKHHKKYRKYRKAVEEMLQRTDTEWGPWTIIEATDKRWSQVRVVETMIRGLEEALRAQGKDVPAWPDPIINQERELSQEVPLSEQDSSGDVTPTVETPSDRPGQQDQEALHA
jgi:AMP-polyphosphate phosphotransferase